MIEGFPTYDQSGDNLDELDIRLWQGVRVGTFSTTTWIRGSIADDFPPIMVLKTPKFLPVTPTSSVLR